MATPEILYIGLVPGSPSHARKLAGIRRYCAARGWEAVPVARDLSTPENLRALLRRRRPAGCIVDWTALDADLSPRLFCGVPLVYVGHPDAAACSVTNFVFDTALVAETAFRELSSGKPSCYAAVGHYSSWAWSRLRIRAFRAAAATAGARCIVFPSRPVRSRETCEAFAERLIPWIAALPERFALFAVSDQIAVLVADAARRAGRSLPRSITLVSVDNFPALCENAATPISSIELDFERMGFVAARALAGGNKSATIGPLLVARRKSTSGRGRHEPWILEAVEIIRREAAAGLTPRRLIERFPASKANFNRRFREAMGHSVLDEILHVRLEAACTLLAQTDTAISAIPGLCGFHCDRSCDALFRRRFKMGMRDWRKIHSRK